MVNMGQFLKGHNFIVSYNEDMKTSKMEGLRFLFSVSLIFSILLIRLGLKKFYCNLSIIGFYEQQPGDFLYFEHFIFFI